MSPRLAAYVLLERAAMHVDAIDGPTADEFRDMLDPLWRGLADDERAALHERDSEQAMYDLYCRAVNVFAPTPK